MRSLESLRNSCIDGTSDGIIYNTTSTLNPGIPDSGNQYIPDVILQTGRYLIETKIDLRFVAGGYYTNGTDTHKVAMNYRTYNTDPDIIDTDYLVLNDGGLMYFQGQPSHYSIIMQSNIVSQFEVIQDTSGGGIYAIDKGIFFNIYCSKPYLNTSTISIKIIKLF